MIGDMNWWNWNWNWPIPLYRKVNSNSNSGLLKIFNSNSTHFDSIPIQFQLRFELAPALIHICIGKCKLNAVTIVSCCNLPVPHVSCVLVKHIQHAQSDLIFNMFKPCILHYDWVYPDMSPRLSHLARGSLSGAHLSPPGPVHPGFPGTPDTGTERNSGSWQWPLATDASSRLHASFVPCVSFSGVAKVVCCFNTMYVLHMYKFCYCQCRKSCQHSCQAGIQNASWQPPEQGMLFHLVQATTERLQHQCGKYFLSDMTAKLGWNQCIWKFQINAFLLPYPHDALPMDPLLEP